MHATTLDLASHDFCYKSSREYLESWPCPPKVRLPCEHARPLSGPTRKKIWGGTAKKVGVLLAKKQRAKQSKAKQSKAKEQSKAKKFTHAR
jgi:hypothetical protein